MTEDDLIGIMSHLAKFLYLGVDLDCCAMFGVNSVQDGTISYPCEMSTVHFTAQVFISVLFAYDCMGMA